MSDETTTTAAPAVADNPASGGQASSAASSNAAQGTSTTTQSAAVEPYHKTWLQADGKLDPKALDRLPSHLAHLKPSLEKIQTMDDVLNIFSNQQILAGKKGLAPLPENAPDNIKAERKALLDSINGVPKDVAGYGILKPKEVPDQYWNPKLSENFAKWAQKHSVSPNAARELVEVNAGFLKEQLKEQEAYEKSFFEKQDEQFNATIKLENIPADKAQQLVERGAQRLGLDMKDPEVMGLMKNAHARTMALRHAIATGEDKFVDGNAASTVNGSPLDQAKDIVHNKANPDREAYWNPNDPRHKAVVEKVQQLHRAAASRGSK